MAEALRGFLSFYSKLVRLKAWISSELPGGSESFLFQIGTIKSIEYPGACNNRFSDVSIPNWYD